MGVVIPRNSRPLEFDSATLGSVRVFDTRQRVDLGPAGHGEPPWTYLDRSAREQFAAARDRINRWFCRLPEGMQASVGQRLRSGDNQEFASAFWELFLHEMFARLSYSIVCEPTLPNGRKIDFLVTRDGASMFVEATIARSSGAERAADARRNRVYRELDRLKTDGFMLGIEIEHAGPGDVPNVGGLRGRLEDWLAGLDPDTVLDGANASEALPSFGWETAGWSMTFEAFPLEPGHRGRPVDRPLGVLMDETGGVIDDETRLRRALDRKAVRHYGPLDYPYVVAVCEFSFARDDADWHRRNVLFGQEAVVFGNGLPARSIRQPDGYWRGPRQRPRNRRLAAALLTTHLYPWSHDTAQLEWWDNPFAGRPVTDDLVPSTVRRQQLALTGNEGKFVTTESSHSISSLFGDPAL